MTAQCMDFLGISEHNHFSSPDNPGNTIANYHKGPIEADNFTASHPNFLALYGMEWGVISGGGHVVVYGDGMNSLFGWESGSGGWGPTNNYDVYVPKSTYVGPTGLFKVINDSVAQNTFATLAHPNLTDFNNIAGTPYKDTADNAIVGVAVESGPAFSTNTTYSNPGSQLSYLWYYQLLLSKGYHLGPTIDHDNHNTTFGHTTFSRTAVIAPSLSKTEIIKAIRNMHFYSTEDCDSKVDFTINTKIMGSVISDRNAPVISVTLTDATTNTSSAIIKVMFGIPGSGILPVKVDSIIGNKLLFIDNNLPVGATGYYYIEITNGSGKIVTSPIWYTRTCSNITTTTQSACNSYRWAANGTTYTTSGKYVNSFTTATGCINSDTLYLTINPSVKGDTTATACNNFNWYGTTYTATGTATHLFKTAAGCDSVVTLHLTVNPNPTVSVASVIKCANDPAVISAAPSPAGVYNYSWTVPTGVVNPGNVANFSATVAGTYNVTVTNSATGCSATGSGTLTVNPNPTVTIPDVKAMPSGVLLNTVYLGYAPASSITLTANVSGGTPGYSYVWSNSSVTSSTTVSPTANTLYNFTVTDANGCKSFANKNINVVDIRSTNNNGNIIVCHQTSQETNTIEVEPNAVSAHLAHGDFLGSCAAPNILTLLRITASPNPSSNYFIITVEGGNVADKISVIITNSLGKIIERRDNLFTKSFRIGGNYIPGLYFIQAIQGNQKAVLTLVKPKLENRF
jgi:hypothetical protein